MEKLYSTFDGNPPEPLITISKLKELHQSNSKSTIQEIREKLKAIIDCEDTDFNDFVDAVAHDYALPAVGDCLIFYTTGRITAYIKQHTQCSTCLNAFLTNSEIHADTISFSCDQLPESLSRFAYIIQFYLQIRIRQFVRQEMAEITKVSVLKKKAAKLCDT